ncbi:MAG: threonylcarbamoyl-AMP synthase [Nitrospirae bacterium]|nr:MAG: threonylcarbamoyl-AMP synthase [Nitrospirota bacterium]
MRGALYPMTEAALHQAASVVRDGGVIAFPTETFYGLGVTPWDSSAVQRLFALKGRSTASSPILVLIRHRKDLESLISEISPSAELLMNACWPGPLTIVFRASSRVPPLLTAGTGTIGIRLSAAASLQWLLDAVDGPLTGTSANRSGALPAVTAQDVQASLGVDVDLVLDGGRTPGGFASTVVDTTVMPVRLIREGALSRSAVLSVIGTLAA